MKPNCGLQKRKTLSPSRRDDRMRRREGRRSKREEQVQREARKRSTHLFNFHIHYDIYKLLQQTGEGGGGGMKAGRRSETPGAHMGSWLSCAPHRRWGSLAGPSLRETAVCVSV